MSKLTAIRHGEILLQPVGKLPRGTTSKQSNYIVGHSETGHHHVLESQEQFDVMLDKAMLYIQLYKPANLVHQKTVNAHKTLTVPAGIYRVIHKTEYSPWDKMKRRVFD